MKSHPYIAATIVGALLAVLVWICVPKKYTAVTKLSDEYKEVDLAVGLDYYQSKIKKALDNSNEGINDIETYCQFLKSEDFARDIARMQVPGKGMTYGAYLGERDTIGVVRDRISYNIHRTQATLTIGFSDEDALVASQMLDSVTNHLQQTITSYRQAMDLAIMKDVETEMMRAADQYHQAQKNYSAFADSNQKTVSVAVKQQDLALAKVVEQMQKHYRNAINKYLRHKLLVNRTYSSFAVIEPNTVPLTTSNYFVSYLIPFVLIALFLVKGWQLYAKRRREGLQLEFGGMFAPWTLTILVWLGIVVLFVWKGEELYPVSNQFYLGIFLWLSIFLVTSFLSFNLMERKKVPFPDKGIEINVSFFYFFFVIAILLSPMYLYRVWQIVSQFDSKDMLYNVRMLSVYGDGMGSLYYALVLAPALLMVALWRYPRMPKWQLTLIILCCIINSLAIMEKGTFFMVVLCSIYVLYEKGKIRLRTIGVVFVSMILLFFVFNMMREGEEYTENETLLGFIAMYIMTPPVAFGTVVEDISAVYGSNSLSMVYALLERFGIASIDTGGKLQEFVFVPIATNVYTILQPFYRDFGYGGIAFFAWLYGLIHGVLYRMSKNGSSFGICMYTYEVQILMLQFYQENIFVSGMYVILLAAVIYLCTQRTFALSLVPTGRLNTVQHDG